MLDNIPKPVLVFFVIAIGIVLIVFLQEPHTVCHSQIEQATKNLRGQIFPSKGKSMALAPKYPKFRESCKIGNSPGACFEYFQVLKKVANEFNAISYECAGDFAQVPAVQKSITEGLDLIAMLAWGEQPPEVKTGWLESPDLVLFCKLKELYLNAFGSEQFAEFRNYVIAKLPGEARVYKGPDCTDCNKSRKALEVLDYDKVWSKSLFSLRCENYR
jgi:hypothetical protein